MATRTLVDRLPARGTVTHSVGYGAIVTVVLSFLPFSSVLGGAAAATRYEAGYLRSAGVALLAGVVAAVPLVAFFVPALAVAGRLGFGIAPSSPAYNVFLALVGAFFLVYTVGFSALGGFLGVWVRDNTDWEIDPVAWV